jgi:hypothetical protein
MASRGGNKAIMSFDKDSPRECKFCTPGTYIIPNADQYKKWHPLNLDGTPHEHNKPFKRATQGSTMRQFYPDNAPPQTEFELNENNDEGYADKQQPQQPQHQQQKPKKSMEQMHDENIGAWNRIGAAIERHNELKEKELEMSQYNVSTNKQQPTISDE